MQREYWPRLQPNTPIVNRRLSLARLIAVFPLVRLSPSCSPIAATAHRLSSPASPKEATAGQRAVQIQDTNRSPHILLLMHVLFSLAFAIIF